MTNNFLSLPVELLLTICNKLDLSNLKNLRLSCKFLAESLSFLILSHIGIKAETIEDLVSRLRYLTNPPSVAVNCTTRLNILGFINNGDDLMLDIVAHEDRQKMRDEVFTAFTSLKAVTTVRWFPQENDPLWFQESIWSAIRCLPALRALSVEATFLNINLENLNTLIALESISIFGPYIGQFEHSAALFENVSRLYTSSTNLISIEFDDLHRVLPQQSDLYHLLAFRPKVEPAICLRHLALSNIPVRMDANTLHHLNNLTSLKLSLADVWSLSGSPDEIWNAFRLSKIHLQELDIGYCAMGHAVNDYLSSFSGLKKLRLRIDWRDQFLDASAIKFWSNSFLNHVDNLQDFGVHSNYDNKWCFGNHNRSVIAKCTKLKRFTISVYRSDILRQESDLKGIPSLIETVLTHMSHIERLDLVVPLYPVGIGALSRLRHRLNDWISKYEPASRFRDRLAEVDVFVE